jgi:3-oxoadipate enol-lactonase
MMARARIGDIEMYYEDQGQGEPVLFIHGLGSSTRDWEYQLPAFLPHYRCICFDVRGHGQTDKPAGPYSVEEFAADTARLLDHLDCGPVHLVTISMGGMIAYQLAVDQPDRLRSMIICNSGPELLLPGPKNKAMLLVRLFIARALGMRRVGLKLAREMFPKPDQVEFREKLATRWAENDRDAYVAATRALIGWSVADRLSAIHCPTLVIKGEGDTTPLDTSDAHLARMPNAARVVIADSLHATPVDQSDRFNRIALDFLASVGGRPDGH